MQVFHFPTWVNKFTLMVMGGLLAGGGYVGACLFVAVHPTTVNVGHRPIQPVPFSHKIHAGQLKLDCRYCHNTVDRAAHAAIPPTATCGNCHGGNLVTEDKRALSNIHIASKKLEPVRSSLETDESIDWIRVHDLPDFVYFTHSAHVTRGVSCVHCHGRVDQMEVVSQVHTLSMKFCLDCHRNPDARLRPVEEVTNLAWTPPGGDAEAVGAKIRKELNINPKDNCSTCHR